MNKILIVFARKPELGMVKTRLAIDLGKEKALEIYASLLRKTIALTERLNVETKIYWSPATKERNGYNQVGNDLGERMYNSLKSEINNIDKLCLIGTDTPSLSETIMKEAFESLDKNDVVFGPSKDGGYYLFGTKTKLPKELFLNKKWSHKNVLDEALQVCQKLNLQVGLLSRLMDIDTLKDYNNWQKIK